MATRVHLSADEFLRDPSCANWCELVRGEVLRSSPTGPLHGHVVGNMYSPLDDFVQARRLGWVFGANVGFHLNIPGGQGDTVRAPDAAFVSHARLPVLTHDFVRGAPEFAAEVLSPDDTAEQLRDRIDDYFTAGTRLMWIVDPTSRRVTVHSASAPIRSLGIGETLDGGDVLPGLTIPVAALFDGLDGPR